MRCRAHGCQRRLPKNATSIACSEPCAEDLRRQCVAFLAALDGTADPIDLIFHKSAKM